MVTYLIAKKCLRFCSVYKHIRVKKDITIICYSCVLITCLCIFVTVTIMCEEDISEIFR